MATFERTHPWLTFLLDMRRAPGSLWLRLGEAQSKCQHIAGVLLRPAVAERLHRIFLAKGALATTAIEGNTLTEEQALAVVEGRLDLPKSQQYLGQEVANIVAACNEIAATVDGESGELSVELLRRFNRVVLRGLELPPGTMPPGVTRTYSVTVGKYRGAPHEECDRLLELTCAWLNGAEFRPERDRIAYAALRAALAHLYLAWIHPFGDGNGRTARLVEFYLLLHAGVPAPAAHLLSNHYNQTRSDYYRRLQLASDSGGDVLPFVEYAAHGFVDGLTEQIRVIRDQQWLDAWQTYVDEQFGAKPSAAETRQKTLVLALSQRGDWVATSSIDTLSAALAREYATKQSKTITRDLNALVQRGLIDKVGSKVRARREVMLAFRPRRKHDELQD